MGILDASEGVPAEDKATAVVYREFAALDSVIGSAGILCNQGKSI